MTTGKRIKCYHLKLIDELGNCYLDEVVRGFRNRQSKISKWKGTDRFVKLTQGDMCILIKSSGEELWYYEYID
nr:MAG TPA: hypothetical protein [Caudoviricetes sp.]